jgi:hypothetical protein
MFYRLAGGVISEVDPDSMGLNPSWRSALVHAVVGASWPDGKSVDEIERVRDNLRQRLAGLATLAPGSGCYFNEVRLAYIISQCL